MFFGVLGWLTVANLKEEEFLSSWCYLMINWSEAVSCIAIFLLLPSPSKGRYNTASPYAWL